MAHNLSRRVEEGMFISKDSFSRVSFRCYLIGRLEYVILLEKFWIEWWSELLALLVDIEETSSIIFRLEEARLVREHASYGVTFLLLSIHEIWCFRLLL